MSDETKITVDAKMEEFISYIENLTVLEVSKLVKALEERLGVSAAAPMAVAAAGFSSPPLAVDKAGAGGNFRGAAMSCRWIRPGARPEKSVFGTSSRPWVSMMPGARKDEAFQPQPRANQDRGRKAERLRPNAIGILSTSIT